MIDVGPAFQVADAASTEREIEPSPLAITKAVDGRTYHRVLAESKSRSPAPQRNANAKKIHISGSVETLSQTGVASINLTADRTEQVLPDGASIDGGTTYTKTGGLD